MEILKKYKTILLSGLAVVVFFAAAYFLVEQAETKNSQTYAEHIFQDDTVNEINIEIDEADWQDMLENPLEEEYHRADVTINGETVGNVAIRTKGNTSLTSVAKSDSDRYSFKLDFDYYDSNGNYYGLKKLCLNNNYADNSSMREYIAYKIMAGMGLTVPECGYSHITVNGEEWGLYLAVEAVDETFLQTHFDDATGDLYKPEGQQGTGADLVYNGDDISDYTALNLKTNQNSSDGKEIIALMKALESGEGLEDVLDVETALKYIAANVALANFDSYLGMTTHNYYLYEENGYFTIIPWDLNLAFGGFGGGEVDIDEPTSQSMGGGPGGNRGGGRGMQAAENTADAENAENQPNGERPDNTAMPNGGDMPNNGDMPEPPAGMGGENQRGGMPSMGSGEKPLVTTLLENETYRSKYESYLQVLAEKYLTQDYMTAMVTKIHALIAPYVKEDATAFCTYEEFEQACSIDPTDPYSLVYYAVNMAESIENQLNGGEPTFNTSSMKGGGMGGMGGGPDFGGERGNRDGQAQTADAPAADADETEQAADAPPNQNGAQQNGAQGQPNGAGGNAPPDFGGGNPPDMPGGNGGQPTVTLADCLPMLALCGGVFAVGGIVLILFKRKKDLKPPKGS